MSAASRLYRRLLNHHAVERSVVRPKEREVKIGTDRSIPAAHGLFLREGSGRGQSGQFLFLLHAIFRREHRDPKILRTAFFRPET